MHGRGKETRSKVTALTSLPSQGRSRPPQKGPVVPLLGRRLPQAPPAGNLSGLPPSLRRRENPPALPVPPGSPRGPRRHLRPSARALPLACGAGAAPCAAARQHPLPRQAGRQASFRARWERPRIEFIKIF